MADHHVRRSIGEHILRCFVLIVALFIMSLGIALSAKANLGVSPISCTPYVLSLALPLTMGTVTILMHLSFVAVQPWSAVQAVPSSCLCSVGAGCSPRAGLRLKTGARPRIMEK